MCVYVLLCLASPFSVLSIFLALRPFPYWSIYLAACPGSSFVVLPLAVVAVLIKLLHLSPPPCPSPPFFMSLLSGASSSLLGCSLSLSLSLFLLSSVCVLAVYRAVIVRPPHHASPAEDKVRDRQKAPSSPSLQSRVKSAASFGTCCCKVEPQSRDVFLVCRCWVRCICSFRTALQK